jgi:hypothetical protein
MNHRPRMSTNIAPFRQARQRKTGSNRRQIARSERKSLQATSLVRKAIELMVWEGHRRDDAAKAAGMLPKSLYNAFRKHHVRAYYLTQLEVLRTSERARNIHALCSVRDQTDNQMARVNAVKALEQLEDQAPAGNSLQRSPGLQIVIVQPPATVASAIDVTPSRSSD